MALAAKTSGRSGIPAFLPVFLALAGTVALSGCVQSSANRSAGTQPAAVAAPPATGAPVVLSGVGYTQADIAANPKPVGPSEADIIKPSGSSNQAVSSTPLPGSTGPVMPAPKPVPAPSVAAKPAPKPVVASVPPATEPLPGLAPPPATEPLPGLSAAPPPPPPAAAPMPTQVISAPSPVGVTPSMPTITTMGEASGPAVDEKGFPNLNVPPRQPSAQLLSAEERAKLIAELNALAGRPSQ